jgi:hypothetical protein
MSVIEIGFLGLVCAAFTAFGVSLFIVDRRCASGKHV